MTLSLCVSLAFFFSLFLFLCLYLALSLALSNLPHRTAQVPRATHVGIIIPRRDMSPATAHPNNHGCCSQHLLFLARAERRSPVVHCRASLSPNPGIHWRLRLGRPDVGLHVSFRFELATQYGGMSSSSRASSSSACLHCWG